MYWIGQPGQTDRPLQAPRVKFAFSFDVPVAISNASSEIPLMRRSSSVWSSPMVLLFMAAIHQCTRLQLRGGHFVGSLGLPGPLQSFRSGFGLAERQVIFARDYQFIGAVVRCHSATRPRPAIATRLLQFMKITDMGAPSHMGRPTGAFCHLARLAPPASALPNMGATRYRITMSATARRRQGNTSPSQFACRSLHSRVA
jgi:hypothetical protein